MSERAEIQSARYLGDVTGKSVLLFRRDPDRRAVIVTVMDEKGGTKSVTLAPVCWRGLHELYFDPTLQLAEGVENEQLSLLTPPSPDVCTECGVALGPEHVDHPWRGEPLPGAESTSEEDDAAVEQLEPAAAAVAGDEPSDG